MVGSRVTPNHLTTARLATGLAACVGFAAGDPNGLLWGGVLWIVSCFLDRADGELARLGKSSSARGHLYDFYCDVAVNALLFLAMGIGLRGGRFGEWTIVMGMLAAIGVATASILSERLEDTVDDGNKAYAGVLGFDFDDVLYLFGPAAWLGLFPWLLGGAAVGGPAFALITWHRLRSAAGAAANRDSAAERR